MSGHFLVASSVFWVFGGESSHTEGEIRVFAYGLKYDIINKRTVFKM